MPTVEQLLKLAQDAINQRDAAIAKCSSLEDELAQTAEKLKKTEAELAQLKEDYSRLQLAKVYGWDEKTKNEAYRRISGLIREIDNCLNLLK